MSVWHRGGGGLVALLAFAVLGGGAGCSEARSTTVGRAAGPAPFGLGAPPSALGVAPGGAAGHATSPSGVDVRWERVGSGPTVVGLAELWTAAARDAVSAEGLASAVDGYARRWGGPDAALVSRTALGGVDVFEYRAASLRSAFRRAADPAARAGRFMVAVTLAPGKDTVPGRPIAADPADQRRVPPGTFSIAVLAGNPWP